uniref:Co-chaperone protein p23 n=1 Tax=Rhizophora mucronata TaxID=61149 RepID=A0A2P2K662_RHIMU
MSRHPEVKWAQRVDKVFLTVVLPDSKNAKVNLEPEGVFTFSANAGGENHLYELKLELYDKVNVEESKINVGVRSIFCILEKQEKVWWKKLLRSDGKTPHYVKVDWDKWVDEDDDDKGAGDLDMGGMDFSNFGNMGGMGGLGDDAGEIDDSDDEEEVSKPGASETHKAEEHDGSKGESASTEEKKEAASST